MTKIIEIDSFMAPMPVSFRVIGVGEGVTDVIEKVKSFGYDCVGCQVIDSADDCFPTDEDQMTIIVAKDNEDVANAIAKTFHDAGVLTIGLLYDADHSCYDSVNIEADFKDFPDIIKTLLQPIVTHGMICFDYHDLSRILRDSAFFKSFSEEAEDIEAAVADIQKSLDENNFKNAENLSFHLYWSRDRQPAVLAGELQHLTNLISSLPETINAIWSVNVDDAVPADKIRLSIILSGKELK